MNLHLWSRSNGLRTLFALALAALVAGNYAAHTASAAPVAVACNDVAGLVAALTAANSSGQPTTITLADDCSYTLVAVDNTTNGANGLPTISGNVTIDGRNSLITRAGSAPSFRLFHVASGGSLNLQNITLTNGQGDGAAVYNEGTLSVTSATIADNTQSSAGSILSANNLTVDRTTFRNNRSNNGAGIYAMGASTITRSSFYGNATTVNDGGAVFAGVNGQMTIANSTFSGNSSFASGGALVTVANPTSPAAVTVLNSTFYGNTSGTLDTIHVWAGSITLRNTIVAGSSGGNHNCFATTSGGHNLSSDGSCGGGTGDLINTDPGLLPLVANGGPTLTQALRPGSPAIDAGDPGTCALPAVNNADQRGLPRPLGAACDIGAVEQTPTFVVTSTADSGAGSLRQAILDSNGQANPAGVANAIYFNIPGAGVQTIQPASPLPQITRPVVIDGATQPGASCAAWPPALQVELSGATSPGATALDFAGATLNSVVRGLVINRFQTAINMPSAVSSVIECNFVGTDAAGTTVPSPAVAVGISLQDNPTGNRVGGTDYAQRNLVSGVAQPIMMVGSGSTGPVDNAIQNNYLGTNVNGSVALGGDNPAAITIFGGSRNRITGNLISGGAGGIAVSGDAGHKNDGTVVRGNVIGANAARTAPLPNSGVGIHFFTTDNGPANLAGARIGGPGAGEDNLISANQAGGIVLAAVNSVTVQHNVIANNGAAGVAVVGSGTGNTIQQNTLSANQGLGIDLGGDGVTFNHVGSTPGPNNFTNYPVLYLAASDGSASTRVAGTLNAAAATAYHIETYSNPVCNGSTFGPGASFLGAFNLTTDGNGLGTFDQALNTGLAEGQGVSATATDPQGNTSEFSWCRPVSTTNLNWVAAQPLTLAAQTGGMLGASVQQRISDRYQEKWFRFPVQPGDVVHIRLTNQPGSAVSLHLDPHTFYNQLITPASAASLSAQAADSAFLPSGSLPSGSLPSGSLPSGSLPSGSLPSGSLPTGYLPSGSLPSGSLPSGSLPSGSLPSGSLPSGSLPSGSLPSGSLPSGSLPSGSLPSGSLPSGSLAAYSGAARQSLMAISMDPYATVQTIDRNTYDLLQDLYVRVVGPFDTTHPFTLDVSVEGGACSGVAPVPDATAIFGGSPPASAAHKTLIVTDSGRLPGSPTEVTAALQRLQNLAVRPEVDGVVIDLAASAYPRVAAARDQANTPANLACPTAKNLLAAEIKRIVDAYRAANVGAGGKTSLQYIVLAGSADVIPYFQIPDVAGLADEKQYIPPVKPSSASDAGLQTGLVQGQDAYGTQTSVTVGGLPVVVPDLAVGRLVETANDISAAVDSYVASGGVVTPTSALVTGYDFVGDAALAIKGQLEQGINSPVCASTSAGCYSADALIQAPGLPPSDPTAWHADDLRSKLYAGGHAIAVLSGHFSAGTLLAADYSTGLSAAEVASNPVNLTNVIVMALGCHGGYNLPEPDTLTGISPDPDWAKVFLRKHVAGYIAATGYAYGDTELTEYGERLFVQVSQQLRTGSGPVALGQALVRAKQAYLAQTAQVTGIDQKTLTEMTLYGLPMMQVNMPGQRISSATDPSIVPSASPVTNGPGAGLGLLEAQPVNPVNNSNTLAPALSSHEVLLQNLVDNSTVKTLYLAGKDGVIANPYEPVYPKELYNVTVPGLVLRGVALLGATYSDQGGVTPLTAAPATETSVAHLSFNSDVFYPAQPWLSNFMATLSGGATHLVGVPAQFKSSAVGATAGTLRSFSGMQFKLYYLPANWTDPAAPAAVKAAAVTAAPAILGASAADLGGGSVRFSVNAQADPAAGVQAVWVLYTGQPGSSLYGRWQPLSLKLTNAALAPTLWEETLALPAGANPADLQFMVEAVNGAGLTTLATGNGAYYTLTPPAPPAPPKATTLALLSPPAVGTYLKPTSFTALLTYADPGSPNSPVPLANQAVTFDIGGQQAIANTDANGHATVTMRPVVPPGQYTLQASIRGSAGYQSAAAASAFTVGKDTTAITLSGSGASTVATLADSSGHPLGGKSLFFVVKGGGGSFAASVIADYQGRATLGQVPLIKGTYTLDVYFSGAVPLPTGQTVTLTDPYYEPQHLSGTVEVSNVPPVLSAIAAPLDPVTVGTSVSASVSFRDGNGGGDTHTAVWNWGDGTATSAATINEANGSGTAAGTHTYSAAGVYTVGVVVTDALGAAAQTQFQYVVVYNPNGGFVTGGGWINSPAGDYLPDRTLAAKATFGFNARYQSGATIPAGQTEFNLGSVTFHSTSYDWLVIKGAQAQYHGIGTLNGAAGYTFTLTASDGQADGSGVDRFRIKISNAAGVVYDNQPGAADNATPTMAVGGGNVRVHQ